MTLQSAVTLLDPFSHTKQKNKKIIEFDFIRGKKINQKDKVRIEETYCTLVTVSGKYLEKTTFKNVLKKIDGIRKIFRI